MGAKTKTVLKGFTYMHCDDFAKYLSDMAAKGWHFREWGVGLKFDKGEPEQAVYAVEVFEKASNNDMRPEPNTQEFAEYCESAGWKFIDAKQKYCIFKKIDDNALNLFTPEERVTNAVKGTFSASFLILFFLYALNAFLQWERLFNSFETAIFSSGYLFNLMIWNVMFVGQLLTFIHAIWKRSRLKKAIRVGKAVYIGSRQDGKLRLRWNDVYIGILILLLMYYFFAMDRIELIVVNAIIVGSTFGLAILLNKLRPEHDTSIIIQIGFTVVLFFTIITSAIISISGGVTDLEMQKENLPLQIRDYRETQAEVIDISYYHEGNVFGESDKYFVYGANESIHYYVYRSAHSGVLDRVWEDIIGGKKYNEDMVDCTKEWNALKALRNKLGTYYVRYDDAILEFRDYEDLYLSEEQIDIILKNLELR